MSFIPKDFVSCDSRHIENGEVIPAVSYVDQPYVAVLSDGSWLCVLTSGAGIEGESGQHVVSLRSMDQGKSWSEPVAIEPPDGPEASWAVPLHVPNIGDSLGRVYAFYVYNRDNLREVIAENDWAGKRVDTLGYYAFRYTDDGGATWSDKRYEVPIRTFGIDRENPYRGDIRFFWNVCKPLVHDGKVFIAVHKVGVFGDLFINHSEGCLVVSNNILTEADPTQIQWQTLPDGEIGLRAITGPIAEEQSIVALSDGSLFCVWRTIEGYPCQAYSRDGGHTWTPPEYMTESPGGRKIKNPRAANFVRKFSNGKFLYWFHNHANNGYEGRNPAWLLGGSEIDTPNGKCITWSQPEVVLYADDLGVRMSYPDFIEQDGTIFITETQKSIARTHRVPERILESLWQETANTTVAIDGLIHECKGRSEIVMPTMPLLWQKRGGFTIDMIVHFDDLQPHQILFDSRDTAGRGITVTVTERATLKLTVCGELRAAVYTDYGIGFTECSWECDTGLLQPGKHHCATVTVDGGPKLIQWIIDEKLCDGGEHLPMGWGRFHFNLNKIDGAATARVAPTINGEMEVLRLYDRALLNNEAVANHRADKPNSPTIYRRGESGEAEPAVPGWSMAVDDLFE